MPAKSFFISKKANKTAAKLPLHIHDKIVKAFNIIKQNPPSGEKLQGELNDYYKFRIGDYRIVYKFNAKDSRIEIVKIEHRQGVYK